MIEFGSQVKELVQTGVETYNTAKEAMPERAEKAEAGNKTDGAKSDTVSRGVGMFGKGAHYEIRRGNALINSYTSDPVKQQR